MPWLPMYLDHNDLGILSKWLNEEDDISIIRSTGDKEWKAFDEISINSSGRYCLFHKKSGPLPLLKKNFLGQEMMVKDPFKGWVERRTGANPKQPYFGAGHPAIFWLNIRLENNAEIGMSSFEWIGNHYAIIGNPAPDITKKWWNRLRRWVKKQSTYIPRQGATDGPHKEIYALGSALEKILNGTQRASNP